MTRSAPCRRPRRRGSLALVALIAAGAAAGCHSYLVPFDERPLAARAPVATLGGERLDTGPRGDLVVRPRRDDVEAALGVGLHEVPGGLLVTHRLRPDAPLAPDDLVVYVAAAHPGGGAAVRRAHADALGRATGEAPTYLPAMVVGVLEEHWRRVSKFDAFDPGAPRPGSDGSSGAPAAPRDPPASPAALRASPLAHSVRTAADLSGYLSGVGWLDLDLVVVRGGEEVVVRARLADTTEWQPVRLWAPERTRRHGLDLTRVADLPPGRAPAHAEPDDLLVVRVARDAPAGHAGLRPLAVVHLGAAGAEAALGGPRGDGPLVLRLRGRDGGLEELTAPPRARPTQLWFPLLFSYQADGARAHLGIGPLDVLFHYSARREYVPTSDEYAETYRWAVGTTVQSRGTRAESGTVSTRGVNLGLDGARVEYLFDWWRARRPDEAAGW